MRLLANSLVVTVALFFISGSARAEIGSCKDLAEILANSPFHKDSGKEAFDHIFTTEHLVRTTMKSLGLPRPKGAKVLLKAVKPWSCTGYYLGDVLDIVDLMVDGKHISKVYFERNDQMPFGVLQIDNKVFVTGTDSAKPEECSDIKPIFACRNYRAPPTGSCM